MAKSQKTSDYADELFPLDSPGARRIEQQIADGAVITVTRGELVPWARNPRRRFDETELQSLGADLRARGQDDALIVRPLEGQPGFWEILGGERRWRAGDRTFGGQQQTEIPSYRVRVRYPKDDAEALDIAWLHNAHSVPLTFTEKAAFIEARIAIARESGDADSYRKVAALVDLSHERVRQLENLRKLPDWIRERFDELGLNEKHGRALLSLSDNDDDQRALFRQIERAGFGGMSGNKAEKRAQQMRKTAKAEAEAEAAPAQTSLDLGDVAALPDDAAAPASSTRLLELNQAPTAATSGNPDDAELENDNWQSGVRAQSAGSGSDSGGVASSAPAGSGSGFSTTPEAGATDKRGPRKAPPLPGRAVADELRAVGQFIASGAPIPARLNQEIDMAIAEIETAIAQLKVARLARQGEN